MEILGLIFILWLIGCAFPGSSDGGQFEFMMIPVVIISIALIYGFFAVITYAAVGIGWLTDSITVGVISWPLIFIAAMFANKSLFDWLDRRKTRRATLSATPQ